MQVRASDGSLSDTQTTVVTVTHVAPIIAGDDGNNTLTGTSGDDTIQGLGGRLVERIEGFARPDEWARAYGEINEFEEQLANHGTVVCKFWVHISPQEQLRRFKERQAVAYKRFKITDEDWRNREKWPDYQRAVDDLVAHCSTEFAPWTLVAGNDKKFARVQILKTIVQRLDEAL